MRPIIVALSPRATKQHGPAGCDRTAARRRMLMSFPLANLAGHSPFSVPSLMLILCVLSELNGTRCK